MAKKKNRSYSIIEENLFDIPLGNVPSNHRTKKKSEEVSSTGKISEY
jgi:hypothetical protein